MCETSTVYCPHFPMVLHVREAGYLLHLGRNYWFTTSGGQRCGLSHWWENSIRCLLVEAAVEARLLRNITIYLTINNHRYPYYNHIKLCPYYSHIKPYYNGSYIHITFHKPESCGYLGMICLINHDSRVRSQ